MHRRLLKIDGVTLDLERIVSVSDQGHIALDTYMVSHRVPPSKVEEVVLAWSKCLGRKDKK